MHLALKLVLSVMALGCAQADYDRGGACTMFTVNQCLQPFIEKYGPQDQTTFFNKGNAEHVQEMCSDYTEAHHCMDRFIHNCDEGTRNIFKGVNDMYDYVCGDGMSLLLGHQQCLNGPSLVSELTVCNDTAAAKLQDIQQKMYQYRFSAYFTSTDAGDIDRLKRQLCTVMGELMDCMSSSVLEHCGSEAVEFVLTATRLVVEPAMTQIDCDVNSWGQIDHVVVEEPDILPREEIDWDSEDSSSSSSSSSSSEQESDNEHWWMKGRGDKGSTVGLPVPSDTHSYSCTESEVRQCVQPFVNRYGLQDQTALFARSATRDEDAMRKVCRDFSSVKRCINGFLPRCDETSKRIFEGLYDMYDYTCGDGLYLYLEHQQCFARPDLEQELKECNTTAADSYKQIQEHMSRSSYHSKPDVDKMKKKLCRTTRALVSCMKESVNERCGSDAAEFATTVVNKMLGPTMKEVECRREDTDIISSKMSFTTWLAIAMAIGLLLVAILVVCLRLYVRSRRQQAHRTRLHEAIVNEQREYWDDQTVYRDTTTTAPLPKHPPAYSDIDNKDTEPMLKEAEHVAPEAVHSTCRLTPPPPYSTMA